MVAVWWGEVLRWYGYILAFVIPVYIVVAGIAWLRQGHWRWPNW